MRVCTANAACPEFWTNDALTDAFTRFNAANRFEHELKHGILNTSIPWPNRHHRETFVSTRNLLEARRDNRYDVRPPLGSPDFQEAVIARYALEYASKGWDAAVTVDDEFSRVVAVPENGIDPKKYVIGLLQHRYLEDALPILEALYDILDDADIAYNYGICLSELGRIDESLTPLERCVQL